MDVIYLTDALDGSSPFDLERINQCLHSQQTPLSRGTDFTGRLETRIFADSEIVAKIKSYKGHSEVATQRWIEKRHTLEKELRIYPPDKTWFLVSIKDEIYPGNVTLRREPLHVIGKTAEKCSREEFTRLLSLEYDMVLRTAANTRYMLDMGLSNFVLGPQGSVYYVDDDLYQWDRFLTFAQLISPHLREYGRERINCEQLGMATRASILKHFESDSSWLKVLDEKLRSTFVPDPLRPCYKSFSEAMVGSEYREERRELLPLDDQVALLGDVHGNLEALEAVLQDMDERNLRSAIVLGDIVGYGPNPDECIDVLKATSFRFIRGNHDQATALGRAGKGFSKSARWAIDWTIPRISEENRAWLGSLDHYIKTPDFWAVHGAPRDPTFLNAYVYESTYIKNLDFMKSAGIPICFHGHTHIQGAYVRHRSVPDFWDDNPILEIGPGHEHVLISPGSIGLPRNRSATAQYAIWDRNEKKIEFIRVNYDIQSVIERMKSLEFPDFVSRHLSRLVEEL